MFSSEFQYGTISLKQFSLLAIVLVNGCPVVVGAAAVINGVALETGSRCFCWSVSRGSIGHVLADAVVGRYPIESKNKYLCLSKLIHILLDNVALANN